MTPPLQLAFTNTIALCKINSPSRIIGGEVWQLTGTQQWAQTLFVLNQI
jgi:hypothetical protein